jgi:hypothetical protein
VVRAKKKEEEHKPTPREESDAVMALSTAADIVQHDTGRQLAGAPPRYAAALWALYAARHDGTVRDKVHGHAAPRGARSGARLLRPRSP